MSMMIQSGRFDNYHPDAAALFARFSTPPTTARKILINNLIQALDTGGVWSKLDCLWVLAAADAQAAQQNWKQNNFNLSVESSPTFTVDRGYAGPGGRLDTGFEPSTHSAAANYKLNDAYIGVWTRTEVSEAIYQMGVVAGPPYTAAMTSFSGAAYTYLNQAGAGGAHTAATGVGWISASRTGSTTLKGWKNKVQTLTSTEVSTSLPSGNLKLVGGIGGNSSSQIMAAALGKGLSAAEDVILYDALAAYKTAVGA